MLPESIPKFVVKHLSLCEVLYTRHLWEDRFPVVTTAHVLDTESASNNNRSGGWTDLRFGNEIN